MVVGHSREYGDKHKKSLLQSEPIVGVGAGIHWKASRAAECLQCINCMLNMQNISHTFKFVFVNGSVLLPLNS